MDYFSINVLWVIVSHVMYRIVPNLASNILSKLKFVK